MREEGERERDLLTQFISASGSLLSQHPGDGLSQQNAVIIVWGCSRQPASNMQTQHDTWTSLFCFAALIILGRP